MAFSPFAAVSRFLKGEAKPQDSNPSTEAKTTTKVEAEVQAVMPPLRSQASREHRKVHTPAIERANSDNDTIAETTIPDEETRIATLDGGYRWLRVAGRESAVEIAALMGDSSAKMAGLLSYSPFGDDTAYVLRDYQDMPVMVVESLGDQESASYLSIIAGPKNPSLLREAMLALINSADVGTHRAGNPDDPEDYGADMCKTWGIVLTTVNGRNGAWDRDTFLDSLHDGSVVEGKLDLSECRARIVLAGLTFKGDVNLSNCPLLQQVRAIRCNGNFNVSSCPMLDTLHASVIEENLDAEDCPMLVEYPSGNRVGGDISLRGCTGLRYLPDVLVAKGDISLRDCLRLQTLPQRLVVKALDIHGCTGLTTIPLLMANSIDMEKCSDVVDIHPDCAVSESITMPDGSMTASVEEARAYLARQPTVSCEQTATAQ